MDMSWSNLNLNVSYWPDTDMIELDNAIRIENGMYQLSVSGSYLTILGSFLPIES